MCSVAVIERLRLRRLAWGDAAHQAALQREFGCFDLVVGADVVYVEEALPLLLASIAALLRRDASVSSPSKPHRVYYMRVVRKSHDL